jgi:hypothetical protein
VADFGGQTQMVVKMVVRPIASLSERPAATNDPASFDVTTKGFRPILAADVAPRCCASTLHSRRIWA